jgi:hypothetical protein
MGTVRVKTSRRLWFAAAALASIASIGVGASRVDAQTYRMDMTVVTLGPGDPFVLPISGDWVEPVKGFQLSVAFPPGAAMTDLDITVENSLVGALDPEFIQFNISPTQGSIIGGVLFEVIAPFDGVVLPSVGFPLLIAEITGNIPASAPQEFIAFTFVDGLGSPPVNNTYVVEFASIPPEIFTDGGLDVRHPPVLLPFVRGDANNDGFVDLGDAIFHLNYTFGSGPLPVCSDAGDANDDGYSDVSDAIYLLLYIFTSGPPPGPPYPNPGLDPTADTMICE